MKRRQYAAEYKARIVLEILREENTVSEIGSRENINPQQLHNWKKEFLENAARVFSTNKDEKEARHRVMEQQEEKEIQEKKVGQLIIENDWLKKNLVKSSEKDGSKKQVSRNEKLPVSRQCELLGVNRSSIYYTPKTPSAERLEREEHIKRRIDYWHTKHCYMGVRKLRIKLWEHDGIQVGRKLIRRFMDEMGLCAVYPKPNLSKRNKAHKIFPYLLRNLPITTINQVWAVDITYIPIGKTHMYLTAIIDWHSRFVVGYELSDSLDTAPVLTALRRAIQRYGKPGIINSDQGCQFTSREYTQFLANNNILQSMDGKARWVTM